MIALVSRVPARWRQSYVPPIVLGICVVSFAVASVLRASDWKSDRTLFESALRVAPRSVKVRCNLSAVLLDEKNPNAARRVLDLLEPIAAQARGFGPYLHWKGKAYLYLGESERARATLREALASRADSAEVLVELGNIAITEEDGSEALACFDAVGRTGRLEEHARIGRASALALLSRYDEAADAWLPIVAALPDSIPVRSACAWNLTEAGRAVEAAALVREGLARRSDPRLWTALARALVAGAGTSAEARDAAVRGGSSDADLMDEIDRALRGLPPVESQK
jgi:tetratricopeptide (TPR) repeat protein